MIEHLTNTSLAGGGLGITVLSSGCKKNSKNCFCNKILLGV